MNVMSVILLSNLRGEVLEAYDGTERARVALEGIELPEGVGPRVRDNIVRAQLALFEARVALDAVVEGSA